MRQRKAKDLEKRLAECSEYILENFGADNETPKSVEDIFGRSGDLYVEIGSGKGQFVIKKALMNPEDNFIGIEGQETVILRAAEKAMAISGKGEWPENVIGREQLMEFAANAEKGSEKSTLENLKFAGCFVNSMKDFFTENQLAGVYLNFSDPWPKERHAKRRLTHHIRLMDYAWAIRDGGFIEFKTDNDKLFEFSVEEFRLCEKGQDCLCEKGETRDVVSGGSRDSRSLPGIHDSSRKTRLQVVELTRNLHGEDCTYDSACVTTEYEDKFSGRGKNINYIKAIVRKQF